MITFKKIAVAILALEVNTAFAGIMGSVCGVGNVTIPCASRGWNVGVQALYFKPSYNEWVGGNTTLITTATSSTSTDHLLENRPDWSWGYKLEASYHFQTGNDLNLNWYHLGHQTTSVHFSSSATDTNANTSSMRDSLLTVAPKWDAVNLEFGQLVAFGEKKKIRFHGGAQYVAINTAWGTTATEREFSLGTLVSSTTIQSPTKTTYNGFGPRIGADMSYALSHGLAIYVNGATAVLAGKTKLTDTSTSFTTETIGATSSSSTFTRGSKTTFVPELEGRLGLKYAYTMAQGNLTLDVGYMWINYFNAQTTGKTDNSNFGLQGPYVGLTWLGNVA